MKHLRQYIRKILLEKEMGFLSKVGRWIDTNEWGDEKEDPRKYRHPKLNDVVDAVNSAIEDVKHTEMKNFLWGLNHDYANGIKIESKEIRNRIRDLILEKSLTGNKLEGVATTIAKEVTEYLLDEDVREAFAQRGNLQFQIEVELPEKLIWLRDIIVAMRHHEGFNVDAKYEYDLDATDEQRKDSDLIVNLYLPTDYTNEEIEEFEIEYEGSIRHELEHSGQPTDVLMHVQKTIKSGDDIWKSLENAEKYYIDQAETPAHTADWVQKAKRKGVHAADLIDYELQRVHATGQHFGYSDEELNPFMQRLREVYQYYLMSRWPEQDWPAEYRGEE